MLCLSSTREEGNCTSFCKRNQFFVGNICIRWHHFRGQRTHDDFKATRQSKCSCIPASTLDRILTRQTCLQNISFRRNIHWSAKTVHPTKLQKLLRYIQVGLNTENCLSPAFLFQSTVRRRKAEIRTFKLEQKNYRNYNTCKIMNIESIWSIEILLNCIYKGAVLLKQLLSISERLVVASD